MDYSQTSLLHVLDPPRYVATFLSSAVRPDGRPLQSCRRVALSGELVSIDDSSLPGAPCRGSALARLGSTSAGGYVEAALSKAAAGHAGDAPVVLVSVMLPPVASPVFRTYGDRTSISCMGFDSSAPAPSGDALASSVQHALLASGLIATLESLLRADAKSRADDARAAAGADASVEDDGDDGGARSDAGEAPRLRLRASLDIVVTSFDGNAVDACLMAAAAALLQLRVRPGLTFGKALASSGAPCSLPVPLSFALVSAAAATAAASSATAGSAGSSSSSSSSSSTRSGSTAASVLSLPDPTSLEEGVACGASTVVVGLPLPLVLAAAAGAAEASSGAPLPSLPVLTFSQRFAAGAVEAHAAASVLSPDEPSLLLACRRALELQPLLAALLA